MHAFQIIQGLGIQYTETILQLAVVTLEPSHYYLLSFEIG